MGGSQGIARGGWEEAGRIDGRERRDCGWRDGKKPSGLMGGSEGVDEIFSRLLLQSIIEKNAPSPRRERGSTESVKIGSIDARGIPEINPITAPSHPGSRPRAGNIWWTE